MPCTNASDAHWVCTRNHATPVSRISQQDRDVANHLVAVAASEASQAVPTLAGNVHQILGVAVVVTVQDSLPGAVGPGALVGVPVAFRQTLTRALIRTAVIGRGVELAVRMTLLQVIKIKFGIPHWIIQILANTVTPGSNCCYNDGEEYSCDITHANQHFKSIRYFRLYLQIIFF